MCEVITAGGGHRLSQEPAGAGGQWRPNTWAYVATRKLCPTPMVDSALGPRLNGVVL